MTILEPILYANGALRLTRHGAGRGGNVLVLVDRGDGHSDQVEITDDGADRLDEVIRNLIDAPAGRHPRELGAADVFAHMRNWFSADASRFVPFAHH